MNTGTIAKPKILIVGGGRAGASLSLYFARYGYEIVSLVERNPERYNYLQKEFAWKYLKKSVCLADLQEADLILLVVKDDHLGQLATNLAAMKVRWGDKVVAHTSGALPADVLASLQKKGVQAAAVHPVYAFALDPRENKGVNEIWFNLQGDEKALALFEGIFSHTENKTFRVDVDQKKAIHLASVFYANFYVGLAEICTTILKDTISQERDILPLLNPLLKSSIDTVKINGPQKGLTGPVKRGDIETIASHLQYLEEKHPDLLELYKIFTERLVKLTDLAKHEKALIHTLLTDRQS